MCSFLTSEFDNVLCANARCAAVTCLWLTEAFLTHLWAICCWTLNRRCQILSIVLLLMCLDVFRSRVCLVVLSNNTIETARRKRRCTHVIFLFVSCRQSYVIRIKVISHFEIANSTQNENVMRKCQRIERSWSKAIELVRLSNSIAAFPEQLADILTNLVYALSAS